MHKPAPPRSATGRDLSPYLDQAPGLRPSVAGGCIAGALAVLALLLHGCL